MAAVGTVAWADLADASFTLRGELERITTTAALRTLSATLWVTNAKGETPIALMQGTTIARVCFASRVDARRFGEAIVAECDADPTRTMSQLIAAAQTVAGVVGVRRA